MGSLGDGLGLLLKWKENPGFSMLISLTSNRGRKSTDVCREAWQRERRRFCEDTPEVLCADRHTQKMAL